MTRPPAAGSRRRTPSRIAGSVSTTPPWRRAPLLLARQPMVFLAIVAAAAILAVSAASGPLFLAATGTATLHDDAAQACPESSLPTLADAAGYAQDTQRPSRTIEDGAALRRDDPAVRGALHRAGFPAPYLVAFGNLVVPKIASVESGGLTLFSRPGALAHVHILASAGGSGVWVPDDFAHQKGIRPGQILHSGRKSVRVAGIYRSLGRLAFNASANLPRYWCSWEPMIVPSLERMPPPFLIADLGTVRSAVADINAHWYAPAPVRTLTVPETAAQTRRLAAVPAALNRRSGTNIAATGGLPGMVTHADQVRHGLSGSVLPIDLAGVVVALLLVAGAGGFWALRRGRELRILVSRGVGPVPLAGKAVLEVAPAMVLGALLGLLGAVALVRGIGPSGLLEPDARWRAAGTVGAATVVGLAVVGAVAAAATSERRRHCRVHWPRLIPWELLLIAAAAGCYLRVRAAGAATVIRATAQLNPLLLAFPLLALLGALLLLARLGRTGLPSLSRAAGRMGVASYLAVRRITGTPVVAFALAVGTALPCGILCYAASITASLDTDVRAKYETYVGAEHALNTLASPAATINTGGHGTVVSVLSAQTSIDGQEVSVLGIEPDSFGKFAYHGVALRHLVGRLHHTAGKPVPALLINAPAGMSAHTLTLRNSRLPVRVVARSAVFPGLRDGYQPLLVVDRDTLRHVDPYVNRAEEVWTSDRQLGACTAALARAGVETFAQISPTTFLGSSGLRPVTWIFGYLRALAVLAGLVALAGLVFALASRARQRISSYVLTRRMGLQGRAYRRSLIFELSWILGSGWLVGIGLAFGAIALMYRSLNLDVEDPPPPALAVPFSTLAVTLAVAVLAVVLGAIGTHRIAERANPAEVMRME